MGQDVSTSVGSILVPCLWKISLLRPSWGGIAAALVGLIIFTVYRVLVIRFGVKLGVRATPYPDDSPQIGSA